MFELLTGSIPHKRFTLYTSRMFQGGGARSQRPQAYPPRRPETGAEAFRTRSRSLPDIPALMRDRGGAGSSTANVATSLEAFMLALTAEFKHTEAHFTGMPGPQQRNHLPSFPTTTTHPLGQTELPGTWAPAYIQVIP